MRLSGLGVAVVSLLALVAVEAHAMDPDPAEVARAEALFREGREAMKGGDYAQACPEFAESQRIAPALGTLLNLALCDEQLGSAARAVLELEEFLRSAPASDDRRPLVLEHLTSLRSGMPDDISQPDPDRAEPAPAREADARHEAAVAAPSLAGAYVVGGIGVVALVAAAVTGLMVLDASHTVHEHCHEDACDSEGLQANATGRALLVTNTVALALGAAGIAGGTYLYFSATPHAASRAASADPGRSATGSTSVMAGIGGRF